MTSNAVLFSTLHKVDLTCKSEGETIEFGYSNKRNWPLLSPSAVIFHFLYFWHFFSFVFAISLEELTGFIFLLPQRDVLHSDEVSQCIALQDAWCHSVWYQVKHHLQKTLLSKINLRGLSFLSHSYVEFLLKVHLHFQSDR